MLHLVEPWIILLFIGALAVIGFLFWDAKRRYDIMRMDRPEKFRIRPKGKEHTAGDIDCPACDALDGIRYPHPHRDGPILIHLEFLVHGESLSDSEGGCAIPPIELAPRP